MKRVILAAILCVVLTPVYAQGKTCRSDGQGGRICFDKNGKVTMRCDAKGNCAYY